MKKTKNPNKPTGAELDLLGLLWENGPATVRQLHESSGATTGYTSTLKILQNMAEKGLVERDESSRTHVYRAADNVEETRRGLVGDLLQTAFGGRPGQLVMHALSGQKATPQELSEIRALLEKMEQQHNQNSK